MKKSFLFLMLTLGIFTFQSCEKDQVTTDDFEALGPPELPSSDIFNIPINRFEGVNEKDVQAKSNTRWNWLHAGLNILGWNTAVVLNLAVPVAALSAAFNEDHVYLGEGVYEWRYIHDGLDGASYNVVLTGAYTSTEDVIEWTMMLSQEGGYSDFVWLEGITQLNQSEFTLYRNPERAESYLKLNNKKNADDSEIETTRFTNVILK